MTDNGFASSRLRGIFILAILCASFRTVTAFQAERRTSRLDRLATGDPSQSLDVASERADELPSGEPARAGWDGFRREYGPGWSIVLDRRSGAPLLVEGQGIPWVSGSGNSLEPGPEPSLASLEASLRRFMARHRSLILADDAELVLNLQGSGRLTPETWQVAFDRRIGGIPVAGERYLFVIGHGNLISFGAPRWSRVGVSLQPAIDEADGLRRLLDYLSIPREAASEVLRNGDLLYLPLRAAGTEPPYRGPVGAGYEVTLVRVYVLRVAGEPGTWVGYVDARDGSIRGFFDDNRYAQVKGGVLPGSNDGVCPDGCEQTNYPMPYADIQGSSPQTAGSMGNFSCSPGGSTASTTLAGPYVRVADACGPVSESVTCSADIDLGSSAGTDCAVPVGASAGNTHSARTGFYHLNRISEHGRSWLPANGWLTQQLVDNVNLNFVCNAFWDGASVNFYRSGGGCRNTGENASVFLHEWAHGLDQNDGGGVDNPGEAYADITAFLSTHASCVGRGFIEAGTCSGYGDTCLTCTGVREMDWNQRASHAPATPAGFVTTNCPTDSYGYSGPCGREQHCEAYVSGETLWDLAVRDLPASGLDTATAWQLTDRLWFTSRSGSGGNAYTCSLPSSDGCAANSWFSKLRAVDDDDGNLANGTPHAAAIFAAFNRHAIACGTGLDASNQSTSSCPAISGTTLTVAAGSSSATLSWTAVPSAASYLVLRNDLGCSAGSTSVATVTAPTTTFTDTGLANGFPAYYRVQAVGGNSACQGPVSNCQTVSPQVFAGSIKLNASVYGCSSVVTVTVTDGNVGSSTATATLTSATEPGGETITLTESPAGSGTYTGTITLTSAPAGTDGLLSVVHGDAITASYVDADDGLGGLNLTRQTTAAVDCGNASVSCLGGGGNWSSSTTWAGGVVPGVNDSVLIGNGCTITLDTNAGVGSLVVGEGSSGVLQFEPATARTLTVNGNVTIAAGGTIQSASTGTVTTHLLSVGSNLVVNGTLNLSTNGNTAGAELRFVGAANNTFSGIGPTANLRLLSLSKGAMGNTLEITRAFTVRGAASSDTNGFLASSPFIGTLKISGTFTYSSVVFPPPATYTIPAAGGFWLSNPNFTVAAQSGSPTLAGQLRVSSGTFNIGTAANQGLGLASGSVMTVDGGAVNATGKISVTVSTNPVTYDQSGGTVTVSTLGHSSPWASFDLGSSTQSSFRMRGGSIVVRVPNGTTTGARDYRVATGYYTLTGGTLQFGDAGSGVARNFGMGGSGSSSYTWFPNLVVSNASAGHTVQLVVGPVYGLSATTNPSTTLNLNGFFFAVSGSIANNGTINGTAPNSRLWFYYGSGVQSLSGSGTFTAPLAELRIENPSGVTLTQSAAIATTRVSLVRGTLTNTNKITLGNGGTTSGTTQLGDPSSPYSGGGYDVAPSFNAGSGGIRVEYQQESAPRTTGVEIPASRTLAGVTINNSNGVTLAGGGLAITSFLTLSNGSLATSSANLPTLGTGVTSPPAGSAASYVNGPLAIQLSSVTNVSRTFGIGGPWGWRPVVLSSFHSNGALQTYTAQVLEGSTGGTPTLPLAYLNPVRYVRIQNTANVFSTTTATVQLSYNAAEPLGPTSTARVAQSATPNGTYVSRGGTSGSSPTTGVVSTSAINRGDDYFVLANEAAPPPPPANDTCAAPMALSLNTPVSGTTVNARDDYELTGSACFTSQGQIGNTASSVSGRDVVYSFTAPSSGFYSFRISKSTGVDPILYTASSCPASTFPAPLVVGSCVSAANRRTSGAEEVACQSMTAGSTLYAFVDENPSSGASFEIEVTACDPEVSPHSSPALANPLSCGKEGSVSNGSDWDFYSLGSPGSGSRVFAMIDAIASRSDDTTLQLTSTTDTYEFDDNDGDVNFGAGGLSSVLGGAVAPSGPAYLKVFGNDYVEPYRLYAVVQPPLDSATSESEPNDTAGTANAASNNYFKGTVATSSDADFYSFTATAGDLVYLGLDCDSNRDGTAVDGTLSLIASDGSTVLVTVNGSLTSETPTPSPGAGLSATTPQFAGEGLVYRIRTSGTYYAKVAGTPGVGAPGQDYALSISLNCTVPGAAADLAVSQTADANPVLGGSSVTYNVTVTNNGPGAAGSVSVTDTIPANMTFLSSSAPGDWACGAPSGGQVVCTAATLAPSSSANLLFTYEANYCTGNVQTTHTTAVSSATSDPAAGNNTSSIQTDITDTLSCSDGNACTISDTCQSGVCVSGPSVSLGPMGGLAFSNKTDMSWTAVVGAPAYDLVRGDLSTLRSGAGFGPATDACVASDTGTPTASDAFTPASGDGRWYLVRVSGACGNGTYDDGSASQSSSRDAGIAASPNACP